MNTSYHHGDLKNALIRAGIEILSQDGMQALSLRQVAKQAGVSHTAPYAHFADKQALIAAIAAAGYQKLYQQLVAAQENQNDALARLVALAQAYVQFALDEPDHFKITFSGIVETEQNYPEYVEQSKQCFALVVDGVVACQANGTLAAGDTQLMAVSIWASIHGFAQLLLGNQLPGALLTQYPVTELLRFHLHQFLQMKARS
ncbi:MAG TPA: TetR/AcrR family transcriptional regulator [Phototrophicaceae bacterium]|nr:TetR/AcrR family transcriptional regulator [Phototrophicaceae bacterium]